MGPIRAIQKDSVAAKAGLKVGDTIRSVDGKTPGEDIDPLFLPVYFARKAGQAVSLLVDRTSSNGPSTESLTVVPEDLPGWTENPDHRTAPLTIPAIGIGYQVQTRISRVLPGSEAEKAGVFAPSTKITRIELIHPDPGKGKPDAFGDAETPVELDLSTMTSKDIGTEKEINWAWAFDQLQRAPGRKVLVHYQNGEETGSRTLETKESDPDWFLWIRGFNPGVWNDEREIQKAGSVTEALALGLRRTKKSAISIYRSLRQIVRGDVAMESFSGPLGIAKIGYMVADRGLVDLLMFLGFLSINLAILNFLPIPILDGGHMVFLLWEGVTRRKPNPQVINWAHAIGMIFLLSLFAFVMWIDVFVSSL
jgi:regulator of sigma E protease